MCMLGPNLKQFGQVFVGLPYERHPDWCPLDLAYPMKDFTCPPTPQNWTNLNKSGSARVYRPLTITSQCLYEFEELWFISSLEPSSGLGLAYPMNNFICPPTPQNLTDLDKSGTVRVF